MTGSSNFLEERAHLQSYDTERFGAQRGGIELAETHPIGIGPGQFELLEPISAHSTYVRALAEEGVAGLVVLVALLLATLGVAVRNVMRGRTRPGSARPPCSPPGAGCSRTASSWTPCTGVTCGSSRG